MRIVCPSCAAIYEVPDTRIAVDQSVRCARCGTDWTPLPEPQGPVEAVAPPRPPAPPDLSSLFEDETAPHEVYTAPPSLEARRPTWRQQLQTTEAAVLASWVVSIAALAGLVWAAVAWRGNVMHAWPPSERLYSALGLPAGP